MLEEGLVLQPWIDWASRTGENNLQRPVRYLFWSRDCLDQVGSNPLPKTFAAGPMQIVEAPISIVLSRGVVYRIGALAIADCGYKSANTGFPTLKGWGLPKRSWIKAAGSRPMQWYIVA